MCGQGLACMREWILFLYCLINVIAVLVQELFDRLSKLACAECDSDIVYMNMHASQVFLKFISAINVIAIVD